MFGFVSLSKSENIKKIRLYEISFGNINYQKINAYLYFVFGCSISKPFAIKSLNIQEFLAMKTLVLSEEKEI